MGKRSTRRRYRMVNAGLAPQSRPKNDRPSRRHLHQKRELKAAAQVCGQGWVLLHRKPIVNWTPTAEERVRESGQPKLAVG